jgi:hypothetical protein
MAQSQGGQAVSHLVNANKKVGSKSPRTDRQPVVTVAFQQFVKAGFARQLERQLAGANKRIVELEKENERIHRLERAGDMLCAAAAFLGWHGEIEQWNKVKVRKP